MYQLNVGFQLAKCQSLGIEDLQSASEVSSHRADCKNGY